MNKADFIKLIGVEQVDAEYLPVACLLRSGYACAGYYNAELNSDLLETCVLINARLMELRPAGKDTSTHAAIHDFNEFIEEIVTSIYKADEGIPSESKESDAYGKSIPLTAVPFDEIGLVYPVAHISALLRRAEESLQTRIPTFLDIQNKSVVVKLLRTKLW